MIKEHELYHGAAILRLISEDATLDVKRHPGVNKASYVLNDKIGIYIKHSSKRMSPWRFTFLKGHQDEIASMHTIYQHVFILLVCEVDGIAALSFDELNRILDEEHKETEWISATRKKREMYKVKGSDGVLEFKIGDSDYPNKIFTALKLTA